MGTRDVRIGTLPPGDRFSKLVCVGYDRHAVQAGEVISHALDYPQVVVLFDGARGTTLVEADALVHPLGKAPPKAGGNGFSWEDFARVPKVSPGVSNSAEQSWIFTTTIGGRHTTVTARVVRDARYDLWRFSWENDQILDRFWPEAGTLYRDGLIQAAERAPGALSRCFAYMAANPLVPTWAKADSFGK